MINYKTCTKCGEEFPVTEEFFYKKKAGKFGLTATCNVCDNKRGQEYYENNKERCATVGKKWYENNKKKVGAVGKKYRKNNKEKIRISMAEYYQNNKEKEAIRGAKYRKANPDKIAAKSAKRRALKLKQAPVLTEAQQYQIDLIYKIRDELGSNYHVDHIIPILKGGQTHPDNLQIVRNTYNLQKGAKLNFRPPTDKEIFNWD